MLKTYAKHPYPLNIWSTVFQKEVSQEELPPDWEDALNHVLATMPHKRAKETLLLYFREKYTLDEVGKAFGVTRSSAEQNMLKTIDQLRKPTRLIILGYGLAKGREKHTAMLSDKELTANAAVENLPLSVRAIHCLRRADIKTIGQLREYSDEDLFKIRNLGEGTLREIKRALAELANSSLAVPALKLIDEETATMRMQLVADIGAARTEHIKNHLWASDERIADYLISKGWTLSTRSEDNKEHI